MRLPAVWCVNIGGVLIAAGVLAAWADAGQSSHDPAKPACGDYGTAVEFEPTPKLAALRAAKEEKLVMVLHVSGHFEDPKLT